MESGCPPPHLTSEIQETMMQLLVANAQSLAAACTKSILQQVWTECLTCVAMQPELLPPKSGSHHAINDGQHHSGMNSTLPEVMCPGAVPLDDTGWEMPSTPCPTQHIQYAAEPRLIEEQTATNTDDDGGHRIIDVTKCEMSPITSASCAITCDANIAVDGVSGSATPCSAESIIDFHVGTVSTLASEANTACSGREESNIGDMSTFSRATFPASWRMPDPTAIGLERSSQVSALTSLGETPAGNYAEIVATEEKTEVHPLVAATDDQPMRPVIDGACETDFASTAPHDVQVPSETLNDADMTVSASSTLLNIGGSVDKMANHTTHLAQSDSNTSSSSSNPSPEEQPAPRTPERTSSGACCGGLGPELSPLNPEVAHELEGLQKAVASIMDHLAVLDPDMGGVDLAKSSLCEKTYPMSAISTEAEFLSDENCDAEVVLARERRAFEQVLTETVHAAALLLDQRNQVKMVPAMPADGNEVLSESDEVDLL